MIRAFLVLLAVAAVGLLLMSDNVFGRRATPLPRGARADLVVVEKSLHRMTLYSHRRILRRYVVSLGRGGLEPKTREGDGLTPEGHYEIDRRNPHSSFYRALHISYPSAMDRKAAAARGVAPGGDIMIHGLRNHTGWIGGWQRLIDWTDGCIAVTDGEIDEIWRVVPDGTPVEIRR